MLTYAVLCITAFLVLKIVSPPHQADAAGYLLVSSLIPLPVYIIGNSAQAAVFPIDVCLLAYLTVHGLPALFYVIEHKALSAGLGVLFAFSILVTCSGALNFFFVDPDPLKFYAFTIVKFWEYALLGMVLIASRPDSTQLRKICTVVLAGILVYEILHVLHISGVVPLSGEKYYGVQAAEFNAGEMRYAPFSDRTAWFLTTSRIVVGGTASISAWLSLMIFEAYRGRIRVVAAAAAILSAFSVLATGSRSDIAGLAISASVFFFWAPPRRWKVYLCAAIAVASLYAGYLTFFLPLEEQTVAITRMSELWNSELRAEGSYADRSYDRRKLLTYLPEHPRELLIGAGPGNFHVYVTRGITKNFFGHNSYLHWTGELGIGGILLLLAWCLSVCLYAKKRLRSRNRILQLAARTCLAIVAGRMVAAWGAESLFGTQGMGNYSLFFVGVVYLLVSIGVRCAEPDTPLNT
jgi:O-antigen ligase